jgi:RNA polymerase sigma factor (sigma-70 family)
VKTIVLSQENIQAAVNGDPAAISNLINACQPDLLKFARQACATPEDAEDAVQETLWLISQKVGTLRVVNAFMGWAIRIVKNECHRLLRAVRGESELDEENELPSHLDEPDLALLRDDIIAGLMELPSMYREVLILRDIEELTAPEVAFTLDISVDAVKSRLHRARAMLRNGLQHWKATF